MLANVTVVLYITQFSLEVVHHTLLVDQVGLVACIDVQQFSSALSTG